MKPARSDWENRSLAYAGGNWDRETLLTLAWFVPAAVATTAMLLALGSRTDQLLFARLATLGVVVLPLVTFGVVVLGGRITENASLRPSSLGLLDGGVLLAVSLAAVVLVYGPLVGVTDPAWPVRPVLGGGTYLVLPFLLARSLFGPDYQYGVALLTVLSSVGVVILAGGVLAFWGPLVPVEQAVLVVVGVGCSLAVLRRPIEDTGALL